MSSSTIFADLTLPNAPSYRSPASRDIVRGRVVNCETPIPGNRHFAELRRTFQLPLTYFLGTLFYIPRYIYTHRKGALLGTYGMNAPK